MNWPGALALRMNFASGNCDMGTGYDVCIIWGLLGRPEAILTAPGSLSKAAGHSGNLD
jgi:hypothetical protein